MISEFRKYYKMNNKIKRKLALGFPWQTQDPFLFCVFHEDFYPKGNAQLGPDVSLAGRNIGNDFLVKDGFRMYHGDTVPGFPAHPHRGFETVTVVNRGLVDHADSMGGAGRFGNGDVQWMTAGKGVMHSEMFPLLNKEKENPFELFQIWLNLPAAKKMVEPHYKMLWHEDIPVVTQADEDGHETSIQVIAGQYMNRISPSPALDSWASQQDNEVAIWSIKMQPNATFEIPSASADINRSLFFFQGDSIDLEGELVSNHCALELYPEHKIKVKAGSSPVRLLLLQGKPINEPVVQHGPFVMNYPAEIKQTMLDYQETQFGGWPWPRMDQVHEEGRGRFARYTDSKLVEKD